MKIYCSGIGGIGLSAYAALQARSGHEVLGSDRSNSALLDDLREQGITIFLEQDGSHVPEDIDLFVYSEAIPQDAPERERAASFGVSQQSYFQALGEISKKHQVIAVCGTHGKSSTTAMAASVLTDAQTDPSIVVGTKVPDLDGRNWHAGESDLFLLEACEYRRSFLHLSPNIILLLNVTGDHFDAYDSVQDYQKAFGEFLGRLPDDGLIITHGSDPDCKTLAEESEKKWIDADQFDLPELSVPGAHMQSNAQLVVALGSELGLDQDQILESLKSHRGCWRRMELKGETILRRAQDDNSSIPVIDDYAHHPVEVKATLKALKEAHPQKRIVCAFQPHTHDRSIQFYDQFLTAFSQAGSVVLLDVYDARSDIETAKVDIDQYLRDIAGHSNVPVQKGGSIEQAESLLRSEVLQEGDLLVCMGAGTITNLANAMIL